ncbi:probable MNN4-regulates the mannosylphosphorylation [Fusarium fujikuroi IMI 58289]|uniref:Probable MNN4-regulates the mannosylphosphorylation n=1 Tax=Gibberella fujikuroi (strain CBS 195.34 / IMI 58289 / NRRL A-6831) TaxID=1279085 RepID=S0E3E6_GIBF5|nr:probable MNN4-regulates the mannosylphosphorylation [Fusarium fujikuroi IMI 58289]CCT68157.1 probable MNN4-regulates the mannosylphosphorylation [Fusarium fujikuroi IMI 58289]
MFRTSSRSLWGVASRASSIRASQFLPRASIAPLLRQQRAVYSSKSDDENPPPPKQPIDIEAERKRGQELLQSNPSVVSSKSSVANAASTAQGSKSADQDMTSELKHDIDVVKDTFTFTDVPRESSVLGLAGTLPYLGTSLSTVFLAWDLNKPIPTGNSFYDAIMIDHETAKYLLSVIEPLQLGYGAVIISFLGAIHWGLEYAEKQPLRERTRFRYGMGLAASIVAWPTLMLPVEYALTSQFMAFVALYFADSRAATKGWAPRWYGSYRFLLTGMVGFAIFISLIGRAKIKQGDAITAKGLSDNFARSGIADHDTNWEKLEAEEKARRRKQKEEEEKKAKEAEKKKKEEEKKGKKKDGKGGDKAKASEEGDKKNEEKSEDNGDNAEKKEDGKDSESKGEGDSKDEKESDSKDESKDEDKKSESDEDSKGDKHKDSEESSDEDSKDDSKQDSDKKDDKQDKSEDKKDKKENKSDEKKDDKSKGKKDKKE